MKEYKLEITITWEQINVDGTEYSSTVSDQGLKYISTVVESTVRIAQNFACPSE